MDSNIDTSPDFCVGSEFDVSTTNPEGGGDLDFQVSLLLSTWTPFMRRSSPGEAAWVREAADFQAAPSMIGIDPG